MAKLRHLSLHTADPEKTAEFYKRVFDMKEVGRTDSPIAKGVYLSDGTINMAILHFAWDQGLGLDFRGIHHFGVLVDDVDAYTQKLEALGAECFAKRPEKAKGFFETKFHGPDKVTFDITDHPWKGSAGLDAPAAKEERVPEKLGAA